MRSSFSLFAALLVCSAGPLEAQSPTFGLGRAPTDEEIRAWDISISPDGKELPPGQGTAVEGARVYRLMCRRCHGPTGIEGDAPRLVKLDREEGTHPWNLGRILPIRSPYAPTVWDYINRGMPLNREGTLEPDEVYALTALLLYWNDLIEEDEVMDQNTLPLVEMPNRDAWAPLPDWAPNQPRWPGYPY